MPDRCLGAAIAFFGWLRSSGSGARQRRYLLGDLRTGSCRCPRPKAACNFSRPAGIYDDEAPGGTIGLVETELSQRRSSEAFLAALEPLRHQLYGYARRALNRQDSVPDALQEVVLTAWREYPRFVPGTNFRAWVFRILVNTVFNFNKRGARERAVADETAMLDVEAVLEHESEWRVLLEDPDRMRELLDERLAQALDALGETERQCFLLCLFQGFSYKEVSAMLALPLGTVMSHIHRARMKLRQRLAGLAVERRYVSEARP